MRMGQDFDHKSVRLALLQGVAHQEPKVIQALLWMHQII